MAVRDGHPAVFWRREPRGELERSPARAPPASGGEVSGVFPPSRLLASGCTSAPSTTTPAGGAGSRCEPTELRLRAEPSSARPCPSRRSARWPPTRPAVETSTSSSRGFGSYVRPRRRRGSSRPRRRPSSSGVARGPAAVGFPASARRDRHGRPGASSVSSIQGCISVHRRARVGAGAVAELQREVEAGYRVLS